MLIAQAASAPETIILEQILNTNSCYVGEALPLSVEWNIFPAIGRFMDVDIRVPAMETNKFKIYNSHKNADKPNARSLGIPLSGTRAIANLSTTTRNGTKYTVLKIKKIIVPQTAGTLIMDPARISCVMSSDTSRNFSARGKPAGSGNLYQYPLYFNNNFFDKDTKPSDKQLKSVSNKLILNVAPLPSDPPPLFTGITGKYKFSVSISANSVRQGDPLTLTMTVSSDGYLEHIKLPLLELQNGFTNGFRVINNRVMSSISDSSITFTQTVYPRHTGNNIFPPLSFCYFDPAVKKYVESISTEIPFAVKKAHLINGSIFGNQEDKQQLHKSSILLVTIIVLIIITAAITLKLRKTQPTVPKEIKVDHNRAFQQFCDKVKTLGMVNAGTAKEKYDLLNTALGEYICTHLPGYCPGAITVTDITQMLISKNCNAEIIKSAEKVFKIIDQSRFSPASPANYNKTLADAAEIIQKIHKL